MVRNPIGSSIVLKAAAQRPIAVKETMRKETMIAMASALPNNDVLDTALVSRCSVLFFLSSLSGFKTAINGGIELVIAMMAINIPMNCSVNETSFIEISIC